jgi:hypothetical protein
VRISIIIEEGTQGEPVIRQSTSAETVDVARDQLGQRSTIQVIDGGAAPQGADFSAQSEPLAQPAGDIPTANSTTARYASQAINAGPAPLLTAMDSQPGLLSEAVTGATSIQVVDAGAAPQFGSAAGNGNQPMTDTNGTNNG